MNNEPKRTSLMRYRRVSEILRSDNLLSRKLSKNMVAVCKPDQTHEDFPVEVVHVTDRIHEQGIDAYTMPKNDIIRTAHRLLIQNPGPIPVPAAQLQPQPPTPTPTPTPTQGQGGADKTRQGQDCQSQAAQTETEAGKEGAEGTLPKSPGNR